MQMSLPKADDHSPALAPAEASSSLALPVACSQDAAVGDAPATDDDSHRAVFENHKDMAVQEVSGSTCGIGRPRFLFMHHSQRRPSHASFQLTATRVSATCCSRSCCWPPPIRRWTATPSCRREASSTCRTWRPGACR